ncbi:MAG TPA: hypothetical protein VEX17_04705 [Bacillales bacterium]|nr:hypothetical protein [Bacillales bacterium]
MIYSIFLIVFISSFLFVASVFSTVSAQLPENDTISINKSASDVSVPQKPNGVRITSPINGEQIFVNGTDYFTKTGENLLIKGFSVYDKNSSSNCVVSMIINDVKPYQVTNATGTAGDGDYSSWTYDFTSSYLPLKEGSNKITSKLTCHPGNNNAYYSVNVTGLKLNDTFLANTKKPTAVESKYLNGTKNNNLNNSSIVTPDPVGKPSNVVIISPKNSERVNIDEPLLINGSSTYPDNWNCEVFVAEGENSDIIVPNSENQSGFKKAVANGKNGTNDFSSWKISLDPSQHHSKIGPQSITAKLQCYSPNPFMKTSKVNIIAESPKLSEPKSMDIRIGRTVSDANQEIVINVRDSETDKPLVGATLNGRINNDSFTGDTDLDGGFSKWLSPSELSSYSTMDVTVTANADGYKPKKATTSFVISSSFSAVATGISSDSENKDNDIISDTSKNNKEFSKEIIDDVQNRLIDQGIVLPLPFK